MMSVSVQYEKYDEGLLNNRRCNRYSNKPAHDNQFAKSVEAVLYAYPIWKVNFKQYRILYDSNIFEQYINEWRGNIVDEIGILRREYILRIKLIEETMIVFQSDTTGLFIQQRYFEKMPFKIYCRRNGSSGAAFIPYSPRYNSSVFYVFWLAIKIIVIIKISLL